jgi:hypothetical protein
MKGKHRFAVADFQNWMVIALGARVSEDGEGAKGSLAKVGGAREREPSHATLIPWFPRMARVG